MNELKGSKIFVILSIKEGEGFGFLQESSIVSCSLNGHTLQTDPCGVRSSPVFDSELIWETDKKTLRSLRLQNVPIKITVTGVTGRKVGYLLLNLLSASPCPSNKTSTVSHSWHRLLGLNAEAKSSEPKLLLRLIVSDSDKPNKNVEDMKAPRNSLAFPTRASIDISNLSVSSAIQATHLDSERDRDVKSTPKDEEIQDVVEKVNDTHVINSVDGVNVDVKSSSRRESEGSEESQQHEYVVPAKANVTFQSHNTSMRLSVDSGNSDVCEEGDHKMTGVSSPDIISFNRSEAYSTRDSSKDRRSIITNDNMLHAQGDTPNKHIKRGQLSPQTKEGLIRKTVKALERWKEKQQLLYTEKLQQSEKLILQSLENEWRHREIERERVIQDCRTLAQTLQQAMQDVTNRSNQLSLKENKLRLAKDELEMLYMTKYHELNEAARRMEDDYNHQTKLQHLTLTQLETKLKTLEDCNTLYKGKVTIAEEEIDKLKRSTLSNDDISKINQEKICLEKKLEAALKSKIFFKDQWVSAVREANILKLKYTTNITHSQSDPATCRFQELLQNEESLLQFDNDVLRKLKDDIINSERSESHVLEYRNGIREPSPRLDIASPSKKSVSYKSDMSFI